MNDTLQITRQQGFPKELDWKIHMKSPYTAEQFKDRIMEMAHNLIDRNKDTFFKLD